MRNFTVFSPDVPAPGARVGGQGPRGSLCPGALGPSPDPPAFPSGSEGRLCVSASAAGTGEACPQFSPFAPRFPGKVPRWRPGSSPDARAQTPTEDGGGREAARPARPRALPRARPALREGVGHHLAPGRPPHTHTQLRKGLAVAAAALLSTGRFRLTFY